MRTVSSPALAILFLATGSFFSSSFKIKWNDVQQQRFHTGTGQKRGNAAAHHAATDDRCLPDFPDRSNRSAAMIQLFNNDE
jgi:hypothetical protein